jgi:coenzyme F420-reducing hydrogenase delta subunit
MFNMSAAMAGEFVKAAEEMNDQVTQLGPNPLINGKQEDQ